MDQAKAVVGPVVVSLQRRIPFCDGQVFFVDSRLLMGACVESLEGRLEWGVYLINTIKKSFESLIADVVNSTPVVDKKRQIYFSFLVFPSRGHLI